MPRTAKEKASVHSRRAWDCPCGRRVYGNGGKTSHRRACKVWLTGEYLWLAKKLTGNNGQKPTSMPYWKWDELTGRFQEARDRLRKMGGLEP